MSKFLVLALSLLSLNVARAEDVANPCEPTVRAIDTQMSCRSGGNYVEIVIQTLMTPNIPECSHKETHSAVLKLETKNGDLLKQVELNDGEFTFTFGNPGVGGAKFIAPKYGIKFRNCVTPVFGGVSVGN